MRKRYIQVMQNGKPTLIDATDWKPPPRKAPYVRGDLAPYMPVAGPEAAAILRRDKDARMIEGRREHREYLKRNNLIEVGNEMKPFVEHSGKTRENAAYFDRRNIDGFDVSRTNARWETANGDKK